MCPQWPHKPPTQTAGEDRQSSRTAAGQKPSYKKNKLSHNSAAVSEVYP